MTVELEALRERVRAWLRENHVPRGAIPSGRSGEAELSVARAEQRSLFDAGLAGLSFPREHGGGGLTAEHERAFDEEVAGHVLTSRGLLGVSVNIVGRTLATFCTEAQKQRFLPPMLRGDEVWVQLLSEPTGGSDLSALITRATDDGDAYVLNGQKVWSSRAELADYALCPARTNWEAPKRSGITVFMVPLSAPGIEIRRIKQIDGNDEFCEVFLTDVRVPKDHVLGEEGRGWAVVRRWLEFEHAWAGRNNAGRRAPGTTAPYLGLARRSGRIADTGVQRAIAGLHVDIRAHEALTRRLGRGMGAGLLSPGYAGMLKLSSDWLTQRRTELGLAIGAPGTVLWPADDPAGAAWADAYLTSRGSSIGGGTDEIQRNNVAERALDLPREPSPFDDLPFRQFPHN